MSWSALLGVGLWSIGCVSPPGGSNDGVNGSGSGDDTDVEELDSDGDGLSDQEELEFGSDPMVADTDGDGLSDSDELEYGTDPNKKDSDGDGYWDGDEVSVNRDPMDANSKIYRCGWPYNSGKDELAPSSMSDVISVGDTIGNFVAEDQCGDQVEIHDFGGQRKYILLDVSADWCGPCNSLAAWLEGDSDSFEGSYPGLRDAIDNGDIYWITVIDGSASEVSRWREKYPHPEIPVLHDPNGEMGDHIGLRYFPSVLLLNTKMKVVSYRYDRYSVALKAAVNQL